MRPVRIAVQCADGDLIVRFNSNLHALGTGHAFMYEGALGVGTALLDVVMAVLDCRLYVGERFIHIASVGNWHGVIEKLLNGLLDAGYWPLNGDGEPLLPVSRKHADAPEVPPGFHGQVG